MKKAIFFVLILCFVWIGTAAAFSEPSRSGTVNGVSSDFIVIDSHKYAISPTCKVTIQYSEGNAMYQKPGRISDVQHGDELMFYKIANTLTELTIVR